MKVTLSKGGTMERTVEVSEIIIPDLWHIALNQESKEAKDAILEVWHIAHDLKRHIEEMKTK